MSSAEFNGILLNNADYLKPLALTLTRDYESARNLLQETLLRALVNKEKYNVGTNIKAWLYTIMRNIFINDYRKAKRFPVVKDEINNELLINSRQAVVTNDAETGLGLKHILENIHELAVVFKDPFVLYYEGYKYNEIASILKEPLGTIKSRIFFARKLLKQQVSRY